MPLTKDTPKSMIPIEGRPFLEYQLDLFRRNGITDVVLCVGYLADKIMKYVDNGRRFKIKITYSVENDELLGTAGALKNAEPLLGEDFFLAYGDGYLQLEYAQVMKYFREHEELGMMVVYKNYDQYDRSNVSVEDGYVKRYDKSNCDTDVVFIDYGISVLRRKALDLIPPQTPMDLQDFYHDLITRGQLLAFETDRRFYEVGSFEGMKDFEQYLNAGSRMGGLDDN